MGGACSTNEVRNSYKILVGKPEGKRSVGIPRRKWDDNINWILRKLGGKVCTGLIWFKIGPVVDSCEHGNELSGSIKARNFLLAEGLS
jgi:hypothetical protein